MAKPNFADAYSAANLAPTPATIGRRRAVFDKLRPQLDVHRVVDLVRLYFDLPSATTATWFVNSFQQADPTFSLVNNGREARVLSALLLRAAIDDGKPHAPLALVSASCGGTRTAAEQPELVGQAESALVELAAASRRWPDVDPTQVRVGAKTKLSGELSQLVEAPDLQTQAELMKTVADELHQDDTNIAKQVGSVLKPIAAQLTLSHEDLEIMWWLVGGWSATLDRPFAETDLALAVLMAARELAALTTSPIGPAASRPVLYRLISAGRAPRLADVALIEIVDSVPREDLEKLSLSRGLDEAPDLCPILVGIQKARDIGEGTTWHSAYGKATYLSPDIKHPALSMCLQVYRESLLARMLESPRT